MPHLTIFALEEELAGREAALAAALTEAVVSVYGEWARPIVNIQLLGIPRGRWFVGGQPVESTAPTVTFRIRSDAFERPDAETLMARLTRGVSDAVASVFGEASREEITVDLVQTRDGRPALCENSSFTAAAREPLVQPGAELAGDDWLTHIAAYPGRST